ncbi:MAG: hypothetical protein ACREFQ_15260, partial [Stellaceae bacterium]
MPQFADRLDATLGPLLNREVLLSERRRMLRLAALLTTILAAILALVSLAPDFVRTIFHGEIPLRSALEAFLPFIAYEIAAAVLLTVLSRHNRNFPTFGRFANAFIETSFPTLLLVIVGRYVAVPIALASWLALLYFLFIILSTLRLDFALSAFTGAVAAVE